MGIRHFANAFDSDRDEQASTDRRRLISSDPFHGRAMTLLS